MNKLMVIVVSSLAMIFMGMSLVMSDVDDRSSMLLYTITFLLFGILVCAYEMAFV